MSRAVLRCTGQPPSSPGPRRHCPQVRRSHQLSLAAGGGNAHLATHTQNLKAASNSIFCARAVVNRSAAGGAAGVCVAQDWCSG